MNKKIGNFKLDRAELINKILRHMDKLSIEDCQALVKVAKNMAN